MIEILLIILAVAVAIYWLEAVRTKDIAVAAAKKYCQARDVQLLDQTVQQIRLSMSRNQHDNWQFWRQFRFEYSSQGVERSTGFMRMLGQKIVSIELDIDPIEVQ